MNLKPEPAVEQYVSDPNSVPFDIDLIKGSEGTTVWLATYTSDGKTARFQLEFAAAKPFEDKESKEFDIATGKGRFFAEPGSDASTLLADLRKALEAKHMPTKVKRISSLPFTYVSFGGHQSQAPGAGFNVKPPGNWAPMKLFIGEGEREGEVFLNINSVMKKGQFSMKDPDYGDIVLSQLAAVL